MDLIQTKIHLRLATQGKKCITIIEGLDDDLDLVRISRAMKRTLNCAATVKMDHNNNEIIQLQGDHRDTISAWLVEAEILTATEATDRVVVHGG